MTELQTEIRDRFRNKPAWESLADSEMVKQMSDVLGALFYETFQEVENARQDAFLSTATNRQAILAHAADRGYLPPRPKPPSGVVTITNQSPASTIQVPAAFQLLDSENRSYYTEEEITIAPNASGTVRVQHLEKDTLTFTGNGNEYQEFKISDWSLVDFNVTVVDLMTGNTLAEETTNFWNASAEDWKFQLIYDVADEYYLRFGNGEFGRKPSNLQNLEVEVWKTNPNVRLLSESKLFPVHTILDVNNIAIPLQVKVAKPIDGGVLRATTERIRQEAQHWRDLGQRMVWKEDYIQLLRNEFPELSFVNVWGEAEQEMALGKLEYRNINKIFVSAYSTVDNNGLSLRLLSTLQEAPHPLGVDYQYVEPVAEGFVLMVSGKVPKGASLTQLENRLTNFLLMHYGKDSPYRKEEFLQAQCYQLLEKDGLLKTNYDTKTAESFTIELIRGNREPTVLNGFSYMELVKFDIKNF